MLKFARLRDFTGGDNTLPSTLRRVEEALRVLEAPATVRFVAVGPQPSAYTLRVGSQRGEGKPGARPGDFDVEVSALPEDLATLFSGSVSPIEMFLRGRLRLRGDVDIARRIYRQLAESQEAHFDICRTGGLPWRRRAAKQRTSRSSRTTTST
jgi:hypothetical protein